MATSPAGKDSLNENKNHREELNDIGVTDVVVIGNGPSAICLSYLLSGNWPYYNGNPHPDKFLEWRLKKKPNLSLLEQDLDGLSEGLEGRSNKPVALLFDTLHHPGADLGEDMPPCLDWRHSPNNQIPHVVLGRGEPGGSWQSMEHSRLTLSLSRWMEMPGFSFENWINSHSHDNTKPGGAGDDKQFCDITCGKANAKKVSGHRAKLAEVFRYYQDYVQETGISERFYPHTEVTGLKLIRGKHINSESGELSDGEEAAPNGDPDSLLSDGLSLFEVRGYHESGKQFRLQARDVVLATGNSDQPNRLGVPGEQLSYVKHRLSELEQMLTCEELVASDDPVLVVGAGLSAADAVVCSLQACIPIIHVFRRRADDPEIALAKLPQSVYPEYHQVYRAMRGENFSPCKCQLDYKAYPLHGVRQFLPDHQVELYGPDGLTSLVKVSLAVVLIGSRPQLSFLPQEGHYLGHTPGQPVSCKVNPVAIDSATYQSHQVPGIFAVGPLVGDNFVRFAKGGALAIASHLNQKKRAEDNDNRLH